MRETRQVVALLVTKSPCHLSRSNLRLAELDEATMSLFRLGVSEIRISGSLSSAKVPPIPPNLISLFAQFAEVFVGTEAAVIMAEMNQSSLPAHKQAAGPLASSDKAGELDILWDQVLGEVQLQMAGGTFDAWLRDTQLVSRNGTRFTVAAKSSFAVEWLQNRLQPLILRVLTGLIREEANEPPVVEVTFVVAEADNWLRRPPSIGLALEEPGW